MVNGTPIKNTFALMQFSISKTLSEKYEHLRVNRKYSSQVYTGDIIKDFALKKYHNLK